MSGDTSEEKTGEASQHKLSRLRDKGQLATYQDASNALSYLVGIAMVLVISAWFLAMLRDLFDMVFMQVPATSLAGIKQTVGMAVSQSFLRLGLFLGVLSLIGVLIGILLNGGMVFSVDPIKPKLQNIDPFQGLKRVFGKRAWIELIKSLVKLVAMAAIVFAIWVWAAGALLRLPICAPDCIAPIVLYLLKWVLFVSAGVFIVLALVDMPLQTRLFLDQQKMTRTEQKNERKDTDMSEEVSREMRRLRDEAANSPPPVRGLDKVTIVVRGGDVLAGFHYIQGETAIPIYCYREVGGVNPSTIDILAQRDIPLLEDAETAAKLMRGLKVGMTVPADRFTLIAMVIHRAQSPSGRRLL